ncbi:MAG: metallophosphoesterase [Candidatus Heimdallarchaeota archaeon]|nr:metallophosphoesterase [Candidatus Heimdallarchaeota archaeon]MCK4876415.1 metallophosphoesterase [Candidatus Heimdallarchaeota archaeon]
MKSKKPYFFIIIAILIISPLTLLTFEVFAQDYNPIHIHLSWQNDTSSTMTVSWKTKDATSSVVQYGTDESYGNEETGDSVEWHHVELTGLSPETIYHYRVGNGETWSTDSYFKTGTLGDHAKFIALGDTQSGITARNKMLRKINNLDIDFALFSGDFVEMGSNINEWNGFLNSYEPFTNHIPMMTTLGNHEKNHSIYYNTFALPGNEEYYSFNFGPVHFSILHTYWEGIENENYTKQIDWLIADLEAHDEYDWNVVMMHRPPFSSFVRYHQGWYDLINESFVPIFEQYEIDLVLTGHEHAYERLYKNNVTYIISGGAGANLYDAIPAYRIDESIYVESTYNFLFLDVYDKQLDVRGFRPDYSLIDQFISNKENKPDLRCENLPLSLDVHWKDTQKVNITIANNGEVAITQETKATVAVSDGNSWDLTVPALAVGEKTLFAIEWKPPEKGTFTWTVTVDTDSEIDEVVEENNELIFTFSAVKVQGASFFGDGPWGIIGVISSIMIVAYATLKRRKKAF